MGVSVSTIRRCMQTFNLCIRATYSSITNEELEDLFNVCRNNFQIVDNRQMYGYLLSLNVRVPFSRVRES